MCFRVPILFVSMIFRLDFEAVLIRVVFWFLYDRKENVAVVFCYGNIVVVVVRM